MDRRPNRAERRKALQEAYRAEHGNNTSPELPSLPTGDPPKPSVPPMPPQPSAEGRGKRHDTALFLTIIFGLATVAAYLLQANGVLTVPWIPSLIGYAVMLGVFCWTFIKWDVPHGWRAWQRWLTLALCGTGVAVLGMLGVTTQYKREHVAIKTLAPPLTQTSETEKSLEGADRLSFLAALRNHSGPKDAVGFTCAQGDERACAKAARYLIAFSEASWPLQSQIVRRIEAALPPTGVAMVSHFDGPDGIAPHLGWWNKMDESQKTIWFAFRQMNITLGSQGDKSMLADKLLLYFGSQ